MNHASTSANSAGGVALSLTGRGTVTGSPGLSSQFTETFTSELVDTGELRLHTVVGGEGPPLLLIPGWPQTWYAWRLLMPTLAENFRVVAIDPRGAGRSDMPAEGYDTGTMASDAAAVMSAFGHERFAVIGHDVGAWTGYALASDYAERIERLVLVEANVPGLVTSLEVFAAQAAINGLWHFTFNRLTDLNERLVEGRERLFFGWQFENKAAIPLEPTAIDVYIEALTAEPAALHASFGAYRALDDTLAQNARRSAQKISVPMLTIAGGKSLGETMGAALATAGADVRSVILDGVGHYPAEEAPAKVLEAVCDFLQA